MVLAVQPATGGSSGDDVEGEYRTVLVVEVAGRSDCGNGTEFS